MIYCLENNKYGELIGSTMYNKQRVLHLEMDVKESYVIFINDYNDYYCNNMKKNNNYKKIIKQNSLNFWVILNLLLIFLINY